MSQHNFNEDNTQQNCCCTKKWSFPLRISLVNVKKSTKNRFEALTFFAKMLYHNVFWRFYLVVKLRIHFEYRTSPPEMFCRKCAYKNFAKFTVKHLCQSLFLIKLQTGGLFSCEFFEIFKNTVFTEHLRSTAFGNIEETLKRSLNYCKHDFWGKHFCDTETIRKGVRYRRQISLLI